MALVLRASVLIPRRFFKETASLRCKMQFMNLGDHRTKGILPIVQVQFLSTNNSKSSTEQYSEIYNGILAKSLRNIKVFSLLTSIGSLASQPFLYIKACQSGNPAAAAGLFAIGAFAIVTPVLLHFIAKKYVIDLYYDPKEDKYIATTYSFLVRKKQITFTLNDVVVPDVAGMFTTCSIKGHPLFFDQKLFTDPSHYIRIMGYDKPLDFKLSNVVSANDCKQIKSER